MEKKQLQQFFKVIAGCITFGLLLHHSSATEFREKSGSSGATREINNISPAVGTAETCKLPNFCIQCNWAISLQMDDGCNNIQNEMILTERKQGEVEICSSHVKFWNFRPHLTQRSLESQILIVNLAQITDNQNKKKSLWTNPNEIQILSYEEAEEARRLKERARRLKEEAERIAYYDAWSEFLRNFELILTILICLLGTYINYLCAIYEETAAEVGLELPPSPEVKRKIRSSG